MKIVADSYIPFVENYFGQLGELVLKPGRQISERDVQDADVLLVRSITPVDEKLLGKSQVKFVGSVTAGGDHLDTHWLDNANIAWSRAEGFNAPPVADYVVSVVAALQRKQLLLEKKIKVAVIGVGNVGKLVAQRYRALNFDVIYCDPLRAENEKNFISTPLHEIVAVDLISLHVPLTKAGKYPTYHFIEKSFLQRQKPHCILLNASRGAVIHSQDLNEFGKHLYWCFDVWEHEPNIDKKVLERAFLATPHIAGYSVQSKIRGIDMIYRAACKAKIIEPKEVAPVNIPHQQLQFAGEKHHWQDIVLGIFNPLIMTAMMRTKLLSEEKHGQLFDEMRNQFNYRHEFSFTEIKGVELEQSDVEVLDKMGILSS